MRNQYFLSKIKILGEIKLFLLALFNLFGEAVFEFLYIGRMVRLLLRLSSHKLAFFKSNDRSSNSQMFFKIGVLKNFAILEGNTCVGVSF